MLPPLAASNFYRRLFEQYFRAHRVNSLRHAITPISEAPARRRRAKWAISVAIFLLIGFASMSAPRQATEYEVKAACLFKFAKFVEWPAEVFANDSEPVVIGIVGDDPFGDALAQIEREQTVQGRKIQIRHYKTGEDCFGSHVLFFSSSVSNQAEEILQRLKQRPILTVGDKEDFVRQGGMIGFALVEKTVRFDINATIARHAGLKASSKLLAVARSVVSSP